MCNKNAIARKQDILKHTQLLFLGGGIKDNNKEKILLIKSNSNRE